jgi:hypothetical protein
MIKKPKLHRLAIYVDYFKYSLFNNYVQTKKTQKNNKKNPKNRPHILRVIGQLKLPQIHQNCRAE